jgi:hypothetical protein
MYSTPLTMHPMIKKVLLLLCLFILAATRYVSAQAYYEMTINYNIIGSNNTARCGSHYEIWAEFEDYERLIAADYLNWLAPNENWGYPVKTITFAANNKVKRIRTYAHRKLENCNSVASGDRYTAYFDYNNYPVCYDGSFNNMFDGYDGRSTINVSIKPVSNVYELTLTTVAKFANNANNFTTNIQVHYTDGSAEEFLQIIPWGGFGRPNGTTEPYTISALHTSRKQIAHVEVYSKGGISWLGMPQPERTENFPVYDNLSNNFTQTIYDPFFDLMDDASYIQVDYKRVLNPIVYGGITPTSNILPATDYVTLTGPSEIPSDYYIWYYQVDGDPNWYSLPFQFQYRNPIRFSGQELFGANYITYLNRNVRIKMVPSCASERESATITLDYRLDAPHIESVTPKNVSCNGAADGSLTIKFNRLPWVGETVNISLNDPVSGDLRFQERAISIAPDGTYTWTPAQPLPPGNYRAEVWGEHSGRGTFSEDAGHERDFQISEPTRVTFSSPTPANVKCFGGSDGSISLNAGGGAGGYNLLYKGPVDAGYNTVPFAANTISISGLGIGDYLIQVKDQNGCPGVAPSGAAEVSVPIRQPDAPLAIDGISLTDPKAFGYSDGSINVILKGGTPHTDGSYNIEWRSADGTLLTATGTPGSGNYTSTVSNLPDGTYTISVTDANYSTAAGNSGCTLTDTFTLTQPPLLTAAIQITDSIACNGDGNGTLTAVAGGGKPFGTAPGYTYVWYQVVGGTPTPIGQTTAVASNLNAGRYVVEVTDANGIEKWSDTTDLIDPAVLQVQLTPTPASCHAGSNGVINALVTGGTPAYRYSWSNGSQSAINTGLPAGTYTVNVTDYHGCQVSDLAIIREPAAALKIDQPVLTLPLAYGYTDGSIKVLLSGGTPLAGGAYNVTWQRADGTVLTTHTGQAVSGGYESLLSNIGAGDYTITVTDANYTGPDPNMKGCTVTATFPLREPPALVVTIARSRYISCKGDADGVLTATASGGVPIMNSPLPYRFQWYRQTAGVYNAIGQTTNVASGLIAGTYKVIITDWNGIQKESAPFVFSEPNTLQVQLATEPVSCASGTDGAVTSTVTGGTGPYHYEWTTGDTTSALRGLTEGSYMVFVKDAHGCETQGQADVFIPNGIVVNADITAPTCTGDCDGVINTLISGGTPPYRYAWSTGSTNGSVNQLCAGKYTLTIQDANNCRRVQSFNLPDPPPLTVNLGPDKTLCNGQVWQLNAAIADPAATYSWGGNPALAAATPQVTLNRAGRYWVTVTDSKGCTGGDTIGIQQRAAPIEAEFVVSTQAFRNETVSFINISNPLPEKVEWVIPANRNITVLQNTPLLAELRFADTGVYRIQLRSYVGDCDKVFYKDVTVLEQQAFPQPGGAQEPFIKTFEVLPNPNNGQFNVRIALDKASEIRLRLINIISNQLVNDRKESAATQFNVGYQLNITAGTYVLLLETPMGHAIRKIIISQ